MYIEGLGYIDDATYNINGITTSNQPTTSEVSKTVQSAFDKILEQETSNQTKTYSLDSIFKEASEKYGVSIDLLKAVAYNESGFDPNATSHCGAMGIMQLMPGTAEGLGVKDAYDPYQNIMGGAKYLSQLSKMFEGNMKLTVAAYNAGPGNVQKYDGVPPFEETQNYVKKVMNTLKNGVDTSGKTVSWASAPVNNNITTDDVDEFTIDEYDLIMTYYEMMMNIISRIGETDDMLSVTNNDEDDSLTSLFKLGSIQYNRNNINLI